jgi:hypothetical protein
MSSKLTYANVTATLALFLALCGSSYAVVQFTGKNIKDASLTTKDVKNHSLLARDFKPAQLPVGAQGPQGLQGAKGDTGDTGDKGDNGTPGTPGTPGSALAYAMVDSNGNLGEAKNVDRATKIDFGSPTTGFYCVHTTVAPQNVVATLYGTGAPAGEIEAVIVTLNCATGQGPYNVQVETFDSAGVLTDHAFFIAIN